jgi:hypothetical protein
VHLELKKAAETSVKLLDPFDENRLFHVNTNWTRKTSSCGLAGHLFGNRQNGSSRIATIEQKSRRNNINAEDEGLNEMRETFIDCFEQKEPYKHYSLLKRF